MSQNIDIILSRPSGVIKMLAGEEAKVYLEWLTAWKETAVKVIESKASSLDEIRFAQGQLNVLKRLLGLKAEITEYQHQKLRGKVGSV